MATTKEGFSKASNAISGVNTNKMKYQAFNNFFYGKKPEEKIDIEGMKPLIPEVKKEDPKPEEKK